MLVILVLCMVVGCGATRKCNEGVKQETQAVMTAVVAVANMD